MTEADKFEVPGLNLWVSNKKDAQSETERTKESDTGKYPGGKDPLSGEVMNLSVQGVQFKIGTEAKQSSEISRVGGRETVLDISKKREAGLKSDGKALIRKNHLRRKSTKVTLLKVKVAQVKRVPLLKKKITSLLNNETEMSKLQDEMCNWMKSKLERNLELFEAVDDDCLTYDQFCTAMVDLDSPFPLTELYALAIQQSTQEPGLISIEDIISSIEPEEEVTVCDLCGFGKARTNSLLQKINFPEDSKPLASGSFPDKKPSQLFSEFIMTKSKSKVGDKLQDIDITPSVESTSEETPSENPDALEHLAKTMRQRNMLVKWNKKTGTPGGPQQVKKYLSSYEQNRTKMKRATTKLKLIRKSSSFRSERPEPVRSMSIAKKHELPEKTSNSKKKNRLKNIFTKAVANVANVANEKGKRLRNIYDMLMPSTSQRIDEEPEEEIHRKGISRLVQPTHWYVLVKLRSLIHDDRVSCPSHFNMLLTSDTLLSYVVYIIGVVNDVHFQTVYISPNRLRHRQMQHPHDNTLAECGYRGYCKSHPQNVILYYDFDLREAPPFIKSTDMSEIYM